MPTKSTLSPQAVRDAARDAYYEAHGKSLSLIPGPDGVDEVRIGGEWLYEWEGQDGAVLVQERHPGGTRIVWQNVPRGATDGLIADIPETILPLVIARLRTLNHEPNTPSRATSLAITHCEEALHWLLSRRESRDSLGITGTYTAAPGDED